MTVAIKQTTIGVLATLIAAFATNLASCEEPINAKPRPERTIRHLLEEQRDALQNLVAVQTDSYRIGKADIGAVVQGHQQLLRVQLELATDPAQRVKLREDAVKLAAELERISAAQYKSGQATAADVLQSQVTRLGLQVDLLRERQRTKKERANR